MVRIRVLGMLLKRASIGAAIAHWAPRLVCFEGGPLGAVCAVRPLCRLRPSGRRVRHAQGSGQVAGRTPARSASEVAKARGRTRRASGGGSYVLLVRCAGSSATDRAKVLISPPPRGVAKEAEAWERSGGRRHGDGRRGVGGRGARPRVYCRGDSGHRCLGDRCRRSHG